MTLTLPVDAELVTVEYLRAVDEIAALVDVRVYTESPPKPTLPHLRVSRVGGLADWPVGHIDRPRIQIESYGATKKSAKDLSATARAAMQRIPGSYAGAVVTAADEVSGEIWLPDPVASGIPATPRYIVVFTLVIHPA